MTDINTLNSLGLGDIGAKGTTEKPTHGDLNKNDFLKLLVTQLKNQNPLEPQEDGDFIAQMAQFGTVDGIGKLNQNFESLASSLQSNQALQASALVGRSVLAPTNQTALIAGQPVQGMVDIPQSVGSVTMNVFNRQGETVRHMVLGPQPAGSNHFVWDGKNDAGEQLTSGTYHIQLEAPINGQATGLPTYMRANVDSVTLGRNGQGMMLNLAGVGPVAFTDIREVAA